MAQWVKNTSAIQEMQEAWVQSLGQKDPIEEGNVKGRFDFGQGSFPADSDGKESACNVGDLGSIPESGRFPGKGIGYPLQ